jgi:hypothetical protein
MHNKPGRTKQNKPRNDIASVVEPTHFDVPHVPPFNTFGGGLDVGELDELMTWATGICMMVVII